MKVLLTGHNGYIGSIMVPMLQNAGHEVVGLDTFYFEDCALEEIETSPISTLRKDIRDVEAADLQGVNAVIHLAALSNDPLGNLDPSWTYEINYLSSVHLAKLSKEAEVQKFLYASSCSMYGAASHGEALNEDAPLNPLTPYAISKVKAEEAISKLADKNFFPVFMRNATAYGISLRLRADVVLNNLTGWAYTTGKIRIMSDGTPWRPIIHIHDISQAFILALTAPRESLHNQAINIGIDSENYQVRDLAEIVRLTVPGCKIEYDEQGGPDPRSYRVDFGKLSRLLPDFKPKWDAQRGAKELYETFKRVELKLEDFQGRKFIRLNQLKYLINSGRLDDSMRWKDGGR